LEKPPLAPSTIHVVESGDPREALERELFLAIALGGDRRRIEVLNRMLTPAANEVLAVATADVGVARRRAGRRDPGFKESPRKVQSFMPTPLGTSTGTGSPVNVGVGGMGHITGELT